MKEVKGYDETQAFTGDFETIKLGGQICKIISAKEEKTTTGKDMLVVAFDIEEGENKGFYQRKFDEAKQSNADAKWQGVHRLLLEDNEGKCNKFFKGFTTSIEASNSGYKFDWDEKKLKGKLFGAIFGREQFELPNGEKRFATKIRGIRSVQKIKEGVEIPEDKLLSPQSQPDYVTVNKDDEDLPF